MAILWWGSSAFSMRNFKDSSNFFYVVDNGMDKSFDMENGEGKEFKGMGGWRTHFLS